MKKVIKAFTIVELLVVMAVIGVLITLSVIGIQQSQKSTRVSRANNATLLVKAQLSSFYNEFRQYPTSLKIESTSDSNKIVYMCNPSSTTCTSSSSSDVYSKVTIDIAGLSEITSYSPQTGVTTSSYKTTCESDVASSTINEEKWKIYYSTENTTSTRPQKFYLATCTESGWKDFSETSLSEYSRPDSQIQM